MSATAISSPRPLRLGEILDQAIRLYRGNFLKFIGIIALVQIPLTLIQVLSSALTFSNVPQAASEPTMEPFGDGFGSMFYLGLVASLFTAIAAFVLLQGVATAALTRAIADSYLGEPIEVLKSYRKIGSSWLVILAAYLIILLLIILSAIWTIVPCVGWFTGLGILVYIFLVIIPLMPVIVVIERQGVFGSLRRTWDLARRRFWWIFGAMLLLYLFAAFVFTGPSALVSLLLQFFMGESLLEPATGFTFQSILQSLVGLVGSLIYLPLQLTTITLMYFDLRVRTEGFDLVMLAQGSVSQPTDVGALTAQAPPAESGGLISGTEMLNFVGVTFVGGIIFLILSLVTTLLGILAMIAGGGPP